MYDSNPKLQYKVILKSLFHSVRGALKEKIGCTKGKNKHKNMFKIIAAKLVIYPSEIRMYAIHYNYLKKL